MKAHHIPRMKIVARTSDPPKVECFICEKEDDISNLRCAMTMKLNDRLNQCVGTLNNGKFLAKLSTGDVVAQEMKYHPRYLADLYNAERAYFSSIKQEESNNNPQRVIPGSFFRTLDVHHG